MAIGKLKILDEIAKLTTDTADEALRVSQMKKIFCLTSGMQLWNRLQELSIIPGNKPGVAQKFPGVVNPRCPCDECVAARKG